MNKNRIRLLILLFITFIITFTVSLAWFTSTDINRDNYIKIGKIRKPIQHEELSSSLFATKGSAFNYSIDIPYPMTHTYDYTRAIKNYPYGSWSYNRSEEIIDIVHRHNGIIPKNLPRYAQNYDTNYFKNNYIAFDGNLKTGFVNDQGFHLFVAICNNAHKMTNPKKIAIGTRPVTYEAFVKFQGETTGRTWNTYYKGNIDFYHNKYYVTRAYNYNKANGQYEQIKRGNWYFYNSADLVITDLGITGDIEINPKRWNIIKSIGRAGNQLLYNMNVPYNGKVDTRAKLIKATYDVTYTPSDINKVTKSLLHLGK